MYYNEDLFGLTVTTIFKSALPSNLVLRLKQNKGGIILHNSGRVENILLIPFARGPGIETQAFPVTRRD